LASTIVEQDECSLAVSSSGGESSVSRIVSIAETVRFEPTFAIMADGRSRIEIMIMAGDKSSASQQQTAGSSHVLKE